MQATCDPYVEDCPTTTTSSTSTTTSTTSTSVPETVPSTRPPETTTTSIVGSTTSTVPNDPPLADTGFSTFESAVVGVVMVAAGLALAVGARLARPRR